MTLGHVMMTTDAVGGVWVYSLALARGLAQRGIRVTLVSLGPPPNGSKAEEARALPPGVDLIVSDLRLEWLDPEGYDADRARSQLLRIAGRLKPDLVHLNGFREGAIAWPCPSVVVAHSCVLSWWHATKGEWPTEKRWSAYADAAAAGIDAATAWVAPTNAFRRSIEQIYRPGRTGWVIPNGIHAQGPSSLNKQAVILASGRVWDHGKNLMALAEVAQELPWPVHIAGAGLIDCDSLPRRNVTWLGEIAHADLRRHMQTSAIYAAPALYEPFGLGILEAAQAGCALVLSDIDSLRELWDRAALHVPPGDAERLRRILQRVCRQGSLRQHLQNAAASRARRYSIEQMLSRYAELYRHVLAPERRHRPVTPGDAEVAA